ncbi:MAG: FAD-binding protein, partial [Blautia sp.]|nr:FAD-binding protein [Blautia sp.]
HIEDTLKGGSLLAGREAVRGLCESASELIHRLEKLGTVFSLEEGKLATRAFGGQSHKRTYYCGSATGKHIVSALVMEVRRYEALGLIERKLFTWFHSALIKEGVCHGALLYNDKLGQLEEHYVSALVLATGGQNALFGKTTGSTICDGYAAGKLFMQGAVLKNLEFIQYHPTTLETAQKRMLISEAVRGEGGRLFYLEGEKRVYFMEEKYGPRGNLMTRDVVAREMFATGKEIYLDISFLGKEKIERRLPEVRELCLKYRGIDITKDPIPVSPSVHFFMGGFAVHLNHETSIQNLFAVGECASMYHGANRLGGNSLLAALYGGTKAASAIAEREEAAEKPDFSKVIEAERETLEKMRQSTSPFPVMYIRDMVAELMKRELGIVREEEALKKGLQDMDYYLSVASQIRYDGSVSTYANFSLPAILTLARATLTCAMERKESRGSHYRSDYPQSKEELCMASLISYEEGAYRFTYDKEGLYES